METLNQQKSGKGARWFWRRPTSATIVSAIAHILFGVFVWNAMKMPTVFDQFMQADRLSKPVAEKIEFVAITPPTMFTPRDTATPRRAAPPRATAPAPASAPIVAPTEIPTTLPPPTVTTEPTPGVIGPLRSGTGEKRGVQPNTDDPRVWRGELEFYYAPKTAEERLDSATVASLRRHVDSLNANSYSLSKFEKGDWTFEKNGQKYGIDAQYIQLGRFKIPTALLALLPAPMMQANPVSLDRDRFNTFMRNDIQYHAQAAMNEEQFRKAIKAIRDRIDRDKRSLQRLPVMSPGPLSSPGERPPPK